MTALDSPLQNKRAVMDIKIDMNRARPKSRFRPITWISNRIKWRVQDWLRTREIRRANRERHRLRGS